MSRRRRRLWGGAIGAAAAIGMATMAGIWAIGGSEDALPPSTYRLWLLAPRDMGALPSRADFCGSVGMLGAPDHCWVFGGAGTITDQAGSWDLTASGTPRTGVVTGLPVESGATVDFTGEQAHGFDTASDYASTTGDYTASQVTVTALFRAREGQAVMIYDGGFTSGTGIQASVTAGGILQMIAEGGTATMTLTTTGTAWADDAWHCVSWVADGTGSAIYVDDVSAAVTGATDHGTISGAGETIQIAGSAAPSMEARVRIDYAAATLIDHQALCGTLYQPPDKGSTKIADGDDAWTQTGGARCYPMSATSAVCEVGGLIPWAWDSTTSSVGWVTEPDAVNRITYSTAIDCTNWTCRNAATATAGKVAPDGSATATEVTVTTRGVDDVYATASGYGVSAGLSMRIWVQCSSGILRLTNAPGGSSLGTWEIDCAVIGGAWTYLTSSSAAVTEVAPWVTTSGGAAGINIASKTGTVTATIWAPTQTEESGTGLAVIPTGSSSVSTGDPKWAVDNTSGRYGSGTVIRSTLTTVAGTCWVLSGTDILLSGAVGSECAGIWHEVQSR